MIFAGIVTYEPELDRLADNISGIAGQVDAVLVYDNGSSNADRIVELVSAYPTVTLLRATSNSGVAGALNRLGEAAIESGAHFLVTLDQDSVSPPGMVAVLSDEMEAGVGIVTPYIVDRNKLTEEEYLQLDLPRVERYTQPARKGAITSGCLVNLTAWSQVGGFDERFFIDYVDYDFNQRVMEAGYQILRANRTHLVHEVGKAVKTWLRVPRRDISGRWELEVFYAFGHSPLRCYYKARNRVLFTRKHGRRLGVTNEGVWQIPQQVVLTVLFEKEKLAKLRAFLSGAVDGVRLPLDRAH
jgi:rhamnosyltransferase